MTTCPTAPEHNWIDITTYNDEYPVMFCTECGRTTIITPECAEG